MAFPQEHHYLTFGGPFGSVEQWTVGLRFSGQPAASQAAELTQATALETVLKAEWAKAGNPVGNGALLAWLKWNRIGTDGRYVNDWTTVKDFAAVASSTAGVSYPNQVALVATLRTSKMRGLAKQGRIYLPSPKYSLQGADKTLSAANALEAATWVATLIHNLNQVDGVGTCYVMSAVREGAREAVRRVEVGTALDTMRSRRGKIIEQRSGFDVSGVASGVDF